MKKRSKKVSRRVVKNPRIVRRKVAKKALGRATLSSEDRIKKVMARELDIDASELTVEEDRGASSFGVGTFYEVSLGGSHGKSWTVALSEDAAHELAIAMVKQNLEYEPELFNQSFIESHIDIKHLRSELLPDVQNHRYEDLKEEADRRPLEFLKDNDLDIPEPTEAQMRKHAEAMSDDDTPGESAEEIYRRLLEGDAEDRWIEIGDEPSVSDRDIEALAEQQAEEQLRDPMSYLEDIYGREDAVKQAIRIAGIDVNEAAEDAVSQDGEGHFLSSYDGHMREAPGGFVYWRTN